MTQRFAMVAQLLSWFAVPLQREIKFQVIRMKAKLIITLALVYAITTMAQTSPAISGGDSSRFAKLPPLKVKLDTVLVTHSNSKTLMIPLVATQHKDSVTTQSIMFRHLENNKKSQFHYKPARNIQRSDDWIGFRDYIVRKRRWKEGHPLPPPTPVMIKR